jgi:hypothetical protein
MGTMLFQLPPDLPADTLAELERASVAGGQDCMPYPTQAVLDNGQLLLQRRIDESGCLNVPWNVPGAGRLMVHTATLMERLTPYQLLIELARGKINQLRGQAADWLMGGLAISSSLADKIRQATLQFGKAVSHTPARQAAGEAEQALALGFAAAEDLVQAYVEQVFQVRHSRQPRLETWLSCGLRSLPAPEAAPAYAETFSAVHIACPWRDIAPSEQEQRWQEQDALVQWALERDLHLAAGPLIDFTGRDIPDWLWEKERDLLSLSGYLCDHVDRVVRRYADRIRTWQITAASNWAGVLAMGDEELLWLTLRLLEAVKKVDPTLETTVGIAQPWGDYLAHQERNQSPFVFADNLLRTGVKLAGLDIELIMALSPRGSYCRDTLDASRVLDLYALLGVPLQVTLGYPSAAGADEQADPDQRLQAGHWRSGFNPHVQSDWIGAFANLAACKPYVRCIRWPHFSDAQPHTDPHCGVVDAAGAAKPGLETLRQLRSAHLK